MSGKGSRVDVRVPNAPTTPWQELVGPHAQEAHPRFRPLSCLCVAMPGPFENPLDSLTGTPVASQSIASSFIGPPLCGWVLNLILYGAVLSNFFNYLATPLYADDTPRHKVSFTNPHQPVDQLSRSCCRCFCGVQSSYRPPLQA